MLAVFDVKQLTITFPATLKFKNAQGVNYLKGPDLPRKNCGLKDHEVMPALSSDKISITGKTEPGSKR